MKRCYRFYFGFLTAQEKWLNKMARDGWHLIKTAELSYDFEPCKPDEYEYRIEFIAQMSLSESKKYRDFLRDMGYDVLYKNFNLDWNTGKFQWRPFGKGMGQLSTSPGTFNRELLIIAKKRDGKPFELHSTNSDKANYLKVPRNAWLSTALFLLALAVLRYVLDSITSTVIILSVIGILTLIPVFLYQKKIHHFKQAGEIQE